MCDPIDIVDPIGWAISKTGLPSYRDAASLAYDTVKGPGDVPKPPPLPSAPPPPIDPTDQIIRRAMASQRLRSATGGSAFRSSVIGPAPIAVPKAVGY